MVDNRLTGFWDTLYTTAQPGFVIIGHMVPNRLARFWVTLYTTARPSFVIISHMVHNNRLTGFWDAWYTTG